MDLLRQKLRSQQAVLCVGTEVEASMVRHPLANYLTWHGLLDLACEQALRRSAPAPQGRTWDELRRELRLGTCALHQQAGQVLRCLDPNAQDELLNRLRSIQRTLLSLETAETKLVDAISSLRCSVLSAAHSFLLREELQSPIRGWSSTDRNGPQLAFKQLCGTVLDKSPLFLEAALYEAKPLTRAADQAVDHFCSLLNQKTVLFIGCGEDVDPPLQALVTHAALRFRSNIKHYYIRIASDDFRHGPREGESSRRRFDRFAYDLRQLNVEVVERENLFDNMHHWLTTELRSAPAPLPALRMQIEKCCKTADDLDAFLRDYFPDVHHQLSAAASRKERITLLFQVYADSLHEIEGALASHNQQMSTAQSGPSPEPERDATSPMSLTYPRNPLTMKTARLLCSQFRLLWGDDLSQTISLYASIYQSLAASAEASQELDEHRPIWSDKTVFLKFLHQRSQGGNWDGQIASRQPHLLSSQEEDDQLVQQISKLHDVANLITLLDHKEPLLGIILRILPPGIHVSLCLLPIIEQVLFARQPRRTVHVLIPKARSWSSGEGNTILYTYHPGLIRKRSLIKQTPDAMRDLAMLIRSRAAQDYFIVRPYGGLVLKDRGLCDGMEPSESLMLSEDAHTYFQRHGLFSDDVDSAIRRQLTLDAPVVFVNWSVSDTSSRSLREWFFVHGWPRDAWFLSQQGLARLQEEQPTVASTNRSIELTNESARREKVLIEDYVNEVRRSNRSPWWDAGEP